MARREIDTIWDRETRNNINENFIELYNEYIGAGLDAKEARQKAEEAFGIVNEAKEQSQRAEDKADSVQNQFNQVVIEGDSSVEAAQARVDTEGNTHDTLKARLDFEQTKVWDEFEGRGINVRWFENLIPNKNDDEQLWDWTPAIQAAIDLAQQKGTPGHSGSQYPDDSYGSKVYIPSGLYSIYDKLHVNGSGVQIVGETKFSSLLFYRGETLTTNDYLINIIGESSTRLRDISIKNLSIRATNDNRKGELHPRGIRISNVSSWKIDNVDIFFLHQPFQTTNAWVGYMVGCEFKHNYRSGYLNNETHNVSIRDCVFGSTEIGYSDDSIAAQLTVRNCWGVRVDSTDFEFGKIAIYLFNNVRGASIENNYFENNANYAVYIRDEASSNDGSCDGISITGNFINHPNGKGIYVRHDNASGRLHAGITIKNNFVVVGNNDYFIDENTKTRAVVSESTFESNSISRGLGEYQYSSNSGWNIKTYNRIMTENYGTLIPTQTSKYNHNVISVYNAVNIPYQSTPLSLTNDRQLRSGHLYLVSIILSESSTVQHNSLHLISVRNSVQTITDIIPLTAGTLNINNSLITYEKTSGFSCGVEMTIIPIG